MSVLYLCYVVGAGFFFEGKKDGGLRPHIDYRGLNKITIQNCYPLPLWIAAVAAKAVAYGHSF